LRSIAAWPSTLAPALLALAVLAAATPAHADDDEGPNLGAIGLGAGVDVATAYYFRGIPQEDDGVMTQPWAEISFSLLDRGEENEKGRGSPIGLSLVLGTWNSFHNKSADNSWYESDLYAGVSLALPYDFEFGLSYVYLYGPDLGDSFAHELDFSLSYDDSAFFAERFQDDAILSTFSVSPYIALVQEVGGGSDGLGSAGHKGTYLELGLEPGFDLDVGALLGSESCPPVSFAMPLTVGLNLGDYYETGTGNDYDETFGFFSAGLSASVPLSFIPSKFGSWQVVATYYLLVLGDSVREIGANDFGVSSSFHRVESYGSFGVSFEY
jgi:hypothetical protein